MYVQYLKCSHKTSFLTFLLKKSLVFENTPKNGKLALEVYYLRSLLICVRKKSHGSFLRKSGKRKIHQFCHNCKFWTFDYSNLKFLKTPDLLLIDMKLFLVTLKEYIGLSKQWFCYFSRKFFAYLKD